MQRKVQRDMAGTRIRDKRLAAGMKQANLAKAAGISASYLNLIEHNHRRIGGATLVRLATALGVSASYLSDGADSSLVDGLVEVATSSRLSVLGKDSAEGLAGQFPQWAEITVGLHQRVQKLEQRVQDLSDRLASDPELADALHDMISAVTSIRSTASILANSPDLEPAWLFRFHRNIDEDSRRLAENSQALMRYLEAGEHDEIRTPQDEAQAFFQQHDFTFSEFETQAESISTLMDSARMPLSRQGRVLVELICKRLLSDTQILPRAELAAAVAKVGITPYRLAQELKKPLPVLFRRLAMLGEDLTGPVGLVVCDSSGALIFRKPIAGFVIPRGPAACALWPLYQSLSAPQVTLQTRLRQMGRDEIHVTAYSVSELIPTVAIGMPGLIYGYMLLLPDQGEHEAQMARTVGPDCRICPIDDCPARREPSVLA